MKKPKPPVGTGKRFKALSAELARKGARDPDALAAAIGRKKYGRKFAKMGAMGKRSAKG